MMLVILDYYIDFLKDPENTRRAVSDMALVFIKDAKRKYGGKASPMFRPGLVVFKVEDVDEEVVKDAFNNFVSDFGGHARYFVMYF